MNELTPFHKILGLLKKTGSMYQKLQFEFLHSDRDCTIETRLHHNERSKKCSQVFGNITMIKSVICIESLQSV